MRLTYDPVSNAVYVYFVPDIPNGGVDKTYPCDPVEVGGQINLDFDREGRLLGIEILDARSYLSPELLREAGKPEPSK